jgi:hypothetical protein
VDKFVKIIFAPVWIILIKNLSERRIHIIFHLNYLKQMAANVIFYELYIWMSALRVVGLALNLHAYDFVS